MKRVLCVFALACAMLLPAGLARAGVVDMWDYTATFSFVDVVMENGDNSNMWNSGSTLGWGDKDSGNYREFSLHTNGPDSMYAVYGADSHFNNWMAPHMEMANPLGYANLMSASVRVSFALTPDNGSGDVVNVSVDMPFYFASLEDDYGQGMNYMVVLDNGNWTYIDPVEFVYDGMVYEIVLFWNQDFHGHSTASWTPAEGIRNILGLGADQEFHVMHMADGEGWYMEMWIGVDTLDIRAASAVPVPAAVWLMGTGLAGLMALKRRNIR